MRRIARSYNRLWHKLIDLNMSKSEMCRKAGLTTNALAKLGKGRSALLETYGEICSVLDCRTVDIVEYMPEHTEEK